MADINNISPTKKRDAIIQDELTVQNKWKNTTCTYDFNNNKKFFVTFPYPYMNGTLHLGHAYTISKAEFISRFYVLNGYNVLFPFGFHGTGTPIVACANKLKQELSDDSITGQHSQYSILKSMGVTESEIPNFVDPYYWLQYFPKRAISDLNQFGISADFTRSFVTTNMNPYYDSFVKWQFNKLQQGGKLVYGKKPIIYSPKDNQPCADHDRSIGEGVGIREHILYKFKLDNNTYSVDIHGTSYENIYLLATIKNIPNMDCITLTNILVNPECMYRMFRMQNNIYICRTEAIRNIQYQSTIWPDITVIDICISGDKLVGLHIYRDREPTISIIKSNIPINYGTCICATIKNDENCIGDNLGERIKYYEPEELVVSRSNSVCVVAIIDQWFIDYGEIGWKNKVTEYESQKLVTTNDAVKNSMLKACEWINQWPVSRSIGLGTQLLDTEYLIDSLSDSTIYMAYYTVADKIEKIPIEFIDQDFWDCLFLNGNKYKSIDVDICQTVMAMRNEFLYWYPVDLRVSGKDLISNHLTMCIYNHAAIWDNDKMWPQRYHVNGHILLNGMKMSKSTGNFLTLSDTIIKYGADPTRMSLAMSGSFSDDANFTDNNVNNIILKLTAEKEWCFSIIDSFSTNSTDSTYATNSTNFWDIVFGVELDWTVEKTTKHYMDMDFQKVVVDGIHGLYTIRDNYRSKYENKVIEQNLTMLKKYLDVHLTLIYPICPHYVETIWDYAHSKNIQLNRCWPLQNMIDMKTMYDKDQFNICLTLCRSSYHKIMKRYKRSNKICDPNNLTLHISTYKYSDKHISVLESLQTMDLNQIEWNNVVSTISNQADKTDKTDKGFYGKFIKFIQSNVEIYTKEWINWIIDCADYEILNKWIPKLVDINVTKIIVDRSDCVDIRYIYGPWSPNIRIY
ncbi:MAG: leucyl-tRNA synthetase [Homavirus sp.]|uniref:leucine--tRNA ligase n=1 Tax=Homavirus sp. TaxID=2487769 RepID=A0A3G5A431_9VIRU|nr:MAG: leucyl-tRNA synthetase [Homavirus sp.]